MNNANRQSENTTGLAGKVAIVTGAASGMGAATARELARQGATVMIVDQNADLAGKVASEIGAPAPTIGDVSDSAFCNETVRAAKASLGRVDILVNCAGIILRANAIDTLDSDWQRVLNVNVNGVFFMSRAAVRKMKEQGGGVIVNFGSIWGEVGAAGVVAYCATKGAVHQLTRAMAMDHVGDGIRINAIAPGEVNTPMLAYGRPSPPTAEDLQKLADETIPMRRLAEPVEIARVAVFLATDAASYMTGTIVRVDAGYTAR
jgi:NAD(P)-dependent dehydrogenase (short-subunit alcohol dehydrogenase family)